MPAAAELLAAPQLSVIARDADGDFARIHEVIDHPALVADRHDLERLLCDLLACEAPIVPRTLDLIGHSTSVDSLLLLGDWVIDADNAVVTAFFRELADHDVMARLGIRALRLLGCETASTERGRATIRTLADLLGIEVFGTCSPLMSSCYDASGFAFERRYLLVSSRELRASGAASRGGVCRIDPDNTAMTRV